MDVLAGPTSQTSLARDVRRATHHAHGLPLPTRRFRASRQIMSQIDRLRELATRADQLLQGNRTKLEIEQTSQSAVARWRTQGLTALRSAFGPEHTYAVEFAQATTHHYLVEGVLRGQGILEGAAADLEAGYLGASSSSQDPVITVQRICDRFRSVSGQLLHRREKRETLKIIDEYDVQDLLHALLRLFFDDVRPEEWTPSYAGKCSRVDFLLKPEKIILEVKKTRQGLADREVGDQLTIDIERYKTHPDCGMLICFVYDPDGIIANPGGLENDLSRDSDPFPIRVFVRPSR